MTPLAAGHKKLDRDAWTALQREMIGDDAVEDPDTRVSVRSTGVDVERFDGVSSVEIYGSRQATDVRIRRVQVLCSRDRLVVLDHDGTYPVREWTVLYDGILP